MLGKPQTPLMKTFHWVAGLPCIMHIISLRFGGVILATLRGAIMFCISCINKLEEQDQVCPG